MSAGRSKRSTALHLRIHNVIWKSNNQLDDDDAGLIADDVIEALGSVRDRALDLADACTTEQLNLLRDIWAQEMQRRRSEADR